MPRKKRIKIDFTEDGVKQLMQEVYNESFTLRGKMDILFRTWEAKVKDNVDIATVGSELVKIINAISKNQDQKIQILKLLKDVVFVDSQLNDKNGNIKTSSIDSSKVVEAAERALKDYEDIEDVDVELKKKKK